MRLTTCRLRKCTANFKGHWRTSVSKSSVTESSSCRIDRKQFMSYWSGKFTVASQICNEYGFPTHISVSFRGNMFPKASRTSHTGWAHCHIVKKMFIQHNSLLICLRVLDSAVRRCVQQSNQTWAQVKQRHSSVRESNIIFLRNPCVVTPPLQELMGENPGVHAKSLHRSNARKKSIRHNSCLLDVPFLKHYFCLVKVAGFLANWIPLIKSCGKERSSPFYRLP